VNQPYNWSQVQERTKSKARMSRLEWITRSVIAIKSANRAMATWNMLGIRKL
jgi:hypothetical protein